MGENRFGLTYWRIVGAAVLIGIAALLIFAPVPARAQDGTVSASSAEELILEVDKTPYMLSDGLTVYQRQGRYYLPVSQLASIFDFYVEDDFSRGYVSGWYLDESNAFSVDAARGELTIKGQRRALRPDEIITEDGGGKLDDIYLLLETVQELWPVTLQVDLPNLILYVDTKETLPFEAKLARAEKKKSIEARKRLKPTAKTLPYVENGYRIFGLPTLDLETTYAWDRHAGTLTGQSSISGTQDIAGMSAQYGASFSLRDGRYREPETARVKFSRQAFGDDALFLGFKNMEAGDVRLAPSDLIGGSQSGQGVTLSSQPLQKDSAFDRITIEGTGTPGWDIELYRNGDLIDTGTVDSTGQYRFENVQLTIGNNSIKTVLYGPQGQTQERVEQHSVSGTMAKPGETRYSIGYVDANKPLLAFQPSAQADAEARGGARHAFVAHGLAPWLTLFGSVDDLPVAKSLDRVHPSRRYLTSGAIVSAFNAIGQTEIYKEIGGGTALDSRLLTQLFGIRLNFRNSLFRDFESPGIGFGESAKTLSYEGHASRGFRTPLGMLGLQLDGTRDRRKSGDTTSTIGTRESLNLMGGLQFSNTSTSNFQNTDYGGTNGAFDTTYRISNWELRSNLAYTLHPLRQITSSRGEVRYKPSEGFSISGNLQRDFITRLYQAGLQAGYDFGALLGSANATWSQGTGAKFMVTASASLGPNGPGGRYTLNSAKLSQTAPVRARIFLDNNNNGKFDEDDKPLENAKLLIGGAGTKEESEADGFVTAVASGAGGLVNVEIDKSSLEDPYYQPASEGFSIVPRPGSLPYLEFPIVQTGSIEGSVRRQSNGSPVQGMKIQIVNEKDAVVDSVETAFDGFYSVDFIPPGTYTVRTDPAYGVNVPPQSVTVTPDDLFPSGIDLELIERAGEPPDAANMQWEGGDGIVPLYPPEYDVFGMSDGALSPALTAFLAPQPYTGTVIVKSVRIGEYPDKIRLVLDLSGPVVYTTQRSKDGSTIYIDLPGAVWEALPRWHESSARFLQDYTVEMLKEGGARMRLQAGSSMSVGHNGILNPDGDQGYRLYVDLVKDQEGGAKK